MSLPDLALDHVLSSDTQAVLLLCGRFGRSRDGASPLSDSEYNQLAVWLQKQGMRPSDLLDEGGRRRLDTQEPPVAADRLGRLLERGAALALVVESWTSKGLWVLSRSDDRYPTRLRGRRSPAPPVLYGAGDVGLLSGGGLAIVGSRDASDEALDFVRNVARTCAEQGIQVISGGARGVDNEAMTSATGSDGTAVGVLANDLARTATRGKYRGAIQEGRLVLVSPYDPGSGFNVGHAMRRNRYIYNLADYGLIASSSSGSGGTWQGAVEAIRNREAVFVWLGDQNVPKGNHELIKKGALPFPESPWRKLTEDLKKIYSSSRASEPVQDRLIKEDLSVYSPGQTTLVGPAARYELTSPPETAYEAVLPVMLRYLSEPLNSKDLAQHLDVGEKQAQAWLKKAVEEKKVRKQTRPTRYVAASDGNDARHGRSN